MTSSSEDSTAPLDFRVSSSVSENSKSDYQSEGCPLCCAPRKSFYCENCIRSGDFIHSSSSRYAERFMDKKLKLLQFTQEKNKIQKLCEEKISLRLKMIGLATNVRVFDERVKLLKVLVQDKKEAIMNFKESANKLSQANLERSFRLRCYEERVKKLEYFVKVKDTEKKEQCETLRIAQEKLKLVIRTSIKQLIDYIFPVSVVKQPSSSPSNNAVSVTDSHRVSCPNYSSEKWESSNDVSAETHHCIVAPTLPSSGNYSSYNVYVSADKDAVPGSSNEVVEHNPAYNISAALTYTTQLVNIVAYYLDARLPSKLNYSEFCVGELNEEKKFLQRVARLNWNIVHLCLLQNVSPQIINPQCTLQNILHLLSPDKSDLGRMGPINVDPDESRALEDILRPDLEAFSDFEGQDDDSDHLPYEWEAVANVCLPEALPGAMYHTSISQQQISSSSVASGLVTSAAASIVSLWRGWTK